MSSLAVWEPFADFASLRDDFERMMGSGMATPAGRRWTPAIDIYESDDAIVVKADLPGLTAEDVSVEYDDGILTIRGERKFEEEVERDRYHRIERHYGTIERSFRLPSVADVDNITATFTDGVLELKVPKAAEAKPKKVEITTGSA